MRFLVPIAAWLVAGLIIGLGISLLLFNPQSSPETQMPGPSALPTDGVNNGTNEANDAPSPGSIEVTIIKAPDACPDCTYAQLVASGLADASDSLGVSVSPAREIPSGSPEADALLERYGITMLPAMVITGSPSEALIAVWLDRLGTRESDGALVLRYVYPPYLDIGSGEVKGLVEGIAISPTRCDECAQAGLYLDSLESPEIGIYFINKTVVEENSSEGAALIARHNITRLPTILLSDDVLDYDVFAERMADKGTVESGWFVLRDVSPPYLDLSDDRKVKGVVDIIYIMNGSCTDCFDPRSLPALLAQSYGMYFRNETFYEAGSPEADALIAKYALPGIPSVLFSPDASAYPDFTDEWLYINSTVESDGWYAFRSYEQLVVPYIPTGQTG